MSSILIPVIHHIDDSTSLKNAEIAVKAGCNTLALIQMDGHDDNLSITASRIKNQFPHMEIVINNLSMKSFKQSYEYNCMIGCHTWHDSCGIFEDKITDEAMELCLRLLVNEKSELNPKKFFGGIAFKYQKEENFPHISTRNAYNLEFIPTTSGNATGIAANLDKIKKMSDILPIRHLAIASGITVDNVDDYIPYVKYFFVNTGISKDFYNFDPDLVKKLNDKLVYG